MTLPVKHALLKPHAGSLGLIMSERKTFNKDRYPDSQVQDIQTIYQQEPNPRPLYTHTLQNHITIHPFAHPFTHQHVSSDKGSTCVQMDRCLHQIALEWRFGGVYQQPKHPEYQGEGMVHYCWIPQQGCECSFAE